MNRGLPRPLFFVDQVTPMYKNPKRWDGRRYPLPYTSREDAISLIDDGRAKECVVDWKCFVCGEDVEGFSCWAIAKGRDLDTEHGEAGPYHKVCVDIAMKMCPHLAEGDYYAIETKRSELRKDVKGFW